KDRHLPDHAYGRAEDEPLRAEALARGQPLPCVLQGARARQAVDVRYQRADGQPALDHRRGGSDAHNLRTADLGLLDRRQPARAERAGHLPRRAKALPSPDERRGAVRAQCRPGARRLSPRYRGGLTEKMQARARLPLLIASAIVLGWSSIAVAGAEDA